MTIMNTSVAFHAIWGYLTIAYLLRSLFVSSQNVCTDYPVTSADQFSPSRGENLTLFCYVAPAMSNLTNITWLYQIDDNGTVVMLDASVDDRLVKMVEEVDEGCFIHSLHISPVNMQDSGRYWCRDEMNSSEPVTINVLIPFNFSYPICSVNGEEHILAGTGEMIELSCRAPESNPPWLLQWQRTLPGSTASVEGTRDVFGGMDVLNASVTVSAAQYHGAVLDCVAYCPYFLSPNSDRCGGSDKSSCTLDTFYVTDVPLEDTFHIAPIVQFVTEGDSVTFFCTTIHGLKSGGPTAEFILNTNISVEQVSIPNGHALEISDITYTDNQTTIGCGLFFKGKRYRVKYSTFYVVEPPTTTIGSNYTTAVLNATDAVSNTLNMVNVTDATSNITDTGINTFENDTLWNSTTETTAPSRTEVMSSTLDQTTETAVDITSSSSSAAAASSSSSTTFPSGQGAAMTTEMVLTIPNGIDIVGHPDTNISTIIPRRESGQGPSQILIGLIVGCLTAVILLVIVLIIAGMTLAKGTMGRQRSWSPQDNPKRTYWDYRDEKRPFRLSILSGRIVDKEGSYDLKEAGSDKL